MSRKTCLLQFLPSKLNAKTILISLLSLFTFPKSFLFFSSIYFSFHQIGKDVRPRVRNQRCHGAEGTAAWFEEMKWSVDGGSIRGLWDSCRDSGHEDRRAARGPNPPGWLQSHKCPQHLQSPPHRLPSQGACDKGGTGCSLSLSLHRALQMPAVMLRRPPGFLLCFLVHHHLRMNPLEDSRATSGQDQGKINL